MGVLEMRCEESITMDARPARVPSNSTPLRVWMVVADSESARIHELRDGEELTIGRAPPADIVWPDPSLSRLHARIRRVGVVVEVCDSESRNGCWVGGRRVRRSELAIGDVAMLGGLSVSIQLRPSCEPALLGVCGTATIMQYLESEARRCRLFRRPLSVVAVRAAQPAQLPLAELAAHCADSASPIERIGLYDRELLLAVLPETDAADAARRAHAISEAKGGGARCGVASFSPLATTPEQLVTAAVQALRLASPERPWKSAVASAPVRLESCDSTARTSRSPAMCELERWIDRLAPKGISVLILGETGAGKEIVARELHARSRRPGPLKVVNCAAIPVQLVESVLFGHVKGAFTGADRDQPGAFVQAHRGTLFLDEVGELSPAAQAALLRTLDTHRVTAVGAVHETGVDVRVIAATHRDLAAMTADGSFRLDLYHRLNSIVLPVPPLRERLEELESLIELFVARFAGGSSEPHPRFSPQALACLREYAWPGNVRELRNVVERALAIREGERIELSDLPLHVVQARSRGDEATHGARVAARREARMVTAEPAPTVPRGLRARVRAYEARLIGEALRLSHGNQRRAAGILHLPLRTFERKLEILGNDVSRPCRD